MIRPELPVLALSALPGGPDPVVLCATARLALDLRRAHGELQAAQGKATWRALQSSTPALWLDALVSRALLRGEIPPDAMGGSFLGRTQECKVWEQAIARDAGAAAELFDREGMALAAMEASSLQAAWRIEVPEALSNAEYQAWSRWRADVGRVCRENGWRGMDEILAWRDRLHRTRHGRPAGAHRVGRLPPSRSGDLAPPAGAGSAWRRAVPRRFFPSCGGCRRAAWNWPMPRRNVPRRRPGRHSGWRGRATRLAAVRIAVADLPARRRLLDAALHAALHADAVGAGWAALEPDYEFLAGSPLAEQPLVATALALLQIFASPRRLALADVWRPAVRARLVGRPRRKCDARARIEAGLRRLLPPEASLDVLRTAIGRVLLRQPSLQAPHLLRHLELLGDSRARRHPTSVALGLGRDLYRPARGTGLARATPPAGARGRARGRLARADHQARKA
jgi:hypothetical protein